MQTRSNDGPIQYEDEIKTMTHTQFKKYVLKLSKEIEKYANENNIRIDYVVPILRSGAVPAVYIANELNLIKFAPIQVKKIKQNGKYDHIVLLNSLKDLNKEKELNDKETELRNKKYSLKELEKKFNLKSSAAANDNFL